MPRLRHPDQREEQHPGDLVAGAARSLSHRQASISPRLIRSSSWCAPVVRRDGGWFGYQWDLPAYLVLFAGFAGASCIDIEHMMLPKKIVYPLTVLVAVLLVMAAAMTGTWHYSSSWASTCAGPAGSPCSSP